MNTPADLSIAIMAIGDCMDELAPVVDALTLGGFRCHGYFEVEAAVRGALKLAPQLIVCDTFVHGQSGPEVCQRVVRAARLEHAPVMFLSRTQSADIIRRLHDSHGAYYVRKPVAPLVLQQLAARVIATSHKREHAAIG